MKKSLLLNFVFFFLISFSIVKAQEISLDPVTITSSIIEKRTSETGRNIAVIKGETFSNLPVNSIDELLRYVPGVEIQSRGPMGSQSDIVLRGGTFQQVLVILDGMRLNDPNTGHFNSYIPISPSEIERIEVLKGASSAIYGSEAVGGVIHVITKSFAARLNKNREENVNKHSLSGGISSGSYGLLNVNAGAYLQTNRLAVSGGIQSNNASGAPQRGTKGYFHNNTASVSAQYQLTDRLKLAVRSSFDKRDFSAQNFYTVFASDTANEQVKTSWNQLKISYNMGKSAFSLDAGYKHVSDQYLYNRKSTRNESISELLQGLALWQYQISEQTSLVTGLNYQNRSISSNDRGIHAIHQLAPFMTLSQRFGEYFSTSMSMRVDWRQNIGTEAVPQINLSYKRNNWQLRGSAGKTIRDADFTERFNNYGKALVTGGNVGNPNLKAEKSFSYEAGADWFVGHGFKISGTYFQRLQNNVIDYVSTPYGAMPRQENLSPTGTFGLAKNISDVNTQGVEADIQFSKTFDKDSHLWLMGGITWLSSSGKDLEPSFYISSHAKVLSNFSAIYRYHNWSMSINGLYKVRSPREASALQTHISKNYFLMNAKAEYAVIARKLSLFGQIDNTFDTKYSDLLGAQMPGAWFMGGIKINFEKR